MGVEQAVITQQTEDPAEVLENLFVNGSMFADYKSAADKYIAQADWNAALQIYQDCIDHFPEESDGYRELGVIQERLQDFDSQLESYRKALSLSDAQPLWLYMTLAQLSAERGQESDAIELYRRGFNQYPEEVDGVSYARMARLLSKQGDLEEAVKSYQLALELQPDLDWVAFCIEAIRYNQGVGHLALGEVEEAEAAFQKVNQVKSCWETPVWFSQGAKVWPTHKLDWICKLETLKPRNATWPKISIITPSLNQGEFIEETILSVLNQGYKNVEYIVVDGESIDSTLSILEKYESKISIALVEGDTGQSNAINKGFRLASGQLFSWLNSDDMLAPGALHRIALAYLSSNCDVISGMCGVHHENKIEMIRKPKLDQESFAVKELSDMTKWRAGNFFFQPETFFSRKIWEKCGGSLDETLYYSMDHDLWIRFASENASLQVLNYPIAFFRKHKSQKTSNESASVAELSKVMSAYSNETWISFDKNTNNLDGSLGTSNMSSLENHISLLEQLHADGQWQGIFDTSEKLIKEYPDSSEGYRWLGLAQENEGNSKAVLVSYQRALDRDPYQPDWVYVVAGQILLEASQWDKAIKLLKQATDLYPDNAEAYRWLGIGFENIGQSQEQLASYQKAIELDPNQPVWVYAVLVALLRKNQEYEAAISTGLSAKNIFSSPAKNDASLDYEIAKTYFEFGESQMAVQFYQTALQLNPNLAEAQQALDALVIGENGQQAEVEAPTGGSWPISHTVLPVAATRDLLNDDKEPDVEKLRRRLQFTKEENEMLAVQLKLVNEELEEYLLKSQDQETLLRELNSTLDKRRRKISTAD